MFPITILNKKEQIIIIIIESWISGMWLSLLSSFLEQLPMAVDKVYWWLEWWHKDLLGWQLQADDTYSNRAFFLFNAFHQQMTTLIAFRNKVFTRLMLLSFRETSSNHCNRSSDYHRGQHQSSPLCRGRERRRKVKGQTKTRDQTSSQFYFHVEYTGIIQKKEKMYHSSWRALALYLDWIWLPLSLRATSHLNHNMLWWCNVCWALL